MHDTRRCGMRNTEVAPALLAPLWEVTQPWAVPVMVASAAAAAARAKASGGGVSADASESAPAPPEQLPPPASAGAGAGVSWHPNVASSGYDDQNEWDGYDL
jgi:hypothetical protein